MQRFTVLAIIATMLITAPSGIRAEKEKIRKIALVTFRVGDAEIQRGDKVRKIRVREIIEENDVIRTGKNSRVIVQFSQGSFVAVQALDVPCVLQTFDLQRDGPGRRGA